MAFIVRPRRLVKVRPADSTEWTFTRSKAHDIPDESVIRGCRLGYGDSTYFHFHLPVIVRDDCT